MSPHISEPRRVLEALAAHDRGWLLTPLRGKVPQLTAWQSAPAPSREDVEAWSKRGNLGVRTGVAPGPGGSVLVVVDVDPGASAEWAGLETTLKTVMARTPRGGLHAYLWGPPGLKNSVGQESNSKKLALHVDVRGVGGQCVLVGADGYEWINPPDTTPILAFPQEWLDILADTTKGAVKRAANRVANALPGGRNDTLNREAFRIAAVPGVDPRNARLQLALAASQAGLNKPEIASTLDSAFRARADHNPKVLIPGVHASGQDQPLGQFVEEVLARVPPDVFYARENMLGVIANHAWRSVDAYEVMAIVDKHVRLQRTKDGSNGVDTIPMMCARDHAMAILSNGGRHVRQLRAIASHPVITANDILQSGWHAELGLFIDAPALGEPFDPRELLVDFPIDDVGKANVILQWATMLARPGLDGDVPLSLFTAPSPGSGKTLLCAKIGGNVVLGHHIPVEQWPLDEDEVSKKLLAHCIVGDEAVCLDNVHERLDSAALASTISARWISGRVLGKSHHVRVQNTICFSATGNNAEVSGEMARRAFTVGFRGVENPSARREYKHRHVEQLCLELRPRILAWVLEQIASNRAGEDCPLVMGGFEAWMESVCAPLWRSGLQVLGDEVIRLAQNDENAALACLIEAWERDVGLETSAETSTVLAMVDRLGLFEPRIGSGNERSRLTRLGFVLKSVEGRVVGGRAIRRGEAGGYRTWCLR